jgi:hypothetical protein
VLVDVTTAGVGAFLDSQANAGSVQWTDKFSSCGGLSWRGDPHAAIPLGGEQKLTRRFFPWVRIELSNLKRFRLGAMRFSAL